MSTKCCFSLPRGNNRAELLFLAEGANSQVFRTPKIIEINWLFLMIEQFLCWDRLILHVHPYFGVHGRMVAYRIWGGAHRQIWIFLILTKSMVKYGCRKVPYYCQMWTKTSEMNVSARDVFKKSKIIGIGPVEIFLEQF